LEAETGLVLRADFLGQPRPTDPKPPGQSNGS
jgi:hypothetical protein